MRSSVLRNPPNSPCSRVPLKVHSAAHVAGTTVCRRRSIMLTELPMSSALVALLLIAADAPPADVVLVAPREFLPALKPLIDHRQSQGHRFGYLSSTQPADAIRTAIRKEASAGGLKHVLLVGDAEPAARTDAAIRARSLPAHHHKAVVNVKWGSEPEIASDNWYADLDDDDVPDLSIGRIPADTPGRPRPHRRENPGLRTGRRFRSLAAPRQLHRRRRRLQPAHRRRARNGHQPPAHQRHSRRLRHADDLWQLAQPLLPRSAALSQHDSRAAQRRLPVLGLYRPWPRHGTRPREHSRRAVPHFRRR